MKFCACRSAKYGLIGFSKTAALEYSAHNIRAGRTG
jgi:NAD(P)-dependent dehydrogenase (short-subunit alcohol dehydrogenase family)